MIITGAQRSGTKALAHAFKLRHEELFNPYQSPPKPGTPYIQEASWLAAPHAYKYNEAVIRLVRNPMHVINSLVGIDFWGHEDHRDYRAYIFKYTRHLSLSSPYEMSISYYIQWNLLIEPGAPIIKLESLKNISQLNMRPRANLTETIEKVKLSPRYPELRDLAYDYGYTEEELFSGYSVRDGGRLPASEQVACESPV